MQKHNKVIAKGIVVSLKSSFLEVEINIKNEFNEGLKLPDGSTIVRLLCTRRNRLDHIGCYVNVGDVVLVEEIDWKRLRGVISFAEERTTFCKRPPVANVTDIVVFISVDQPAFDFDQTSRFLLTAEEMQVNVLLVLTKIDLISIKKLEEFLVRLQSWGYQPIPISLKDASGIDILLKKLSSMPLAVLCGPSGVGKTSLINYILPHKSQRVSSVSKKLGRGKHTTRNVELFSIKPGFFIADTPGFNRPELSIDPLEFAFLFPELRLQLNTKRCRFRNCLHRDEPGCMINKDWERYSHYREYVDQKVNLRY